MTERLAVDDDARREGQPHVGRERGAFRSPEIDDADSELELCADSIEWILPTGSEDGSEPWVWVLDSNGVVTDRFDNVATEDELAAAVTRAIG